MLRQLICQIHEIGCERLPSDSCVQKTGERLTLSANGAK